MSLLELVVSRYDEDLSWLGNVPDAFVITVYDKGGEANSGIRHRGSSIPIENVGHEAHTYLHHIVTRYDDLADITVFSQGKPFDHVPDFHRTLKRLAESSLDVKDFLWLGFVIDRDDSTGSLLFRKWHPGKKLPMEEFWQRVFSASEFPTPSFCIFCPGAHFVATAALIRSRPREFYENALNASADLPDAGHCFERCWDQVFGVNGIPEKYRDREYPIYFRPVRRLGITWDDVPPEARPWTKEEARSRGAPR